VADIPRDQWPPIRGWKLAAILCAAALVFAAGILIPLFRPEWGLHSTFYVDEVCNGPGPCRTATGVSVGQMFLDIAVGTVVAFGLLVWACVGRERPKPSIDAGLPRS